MNSTHDLRAGLRAFLIAAALVLLAAPSVFAQRPAGPPPGGGGHGGGYRGPSMNPGSGGGRYNGGGAVRPNHGYNGGYRGGNHGGYYGGGRGYYPYRPVGWGGYGWGWGWGGWGWGSGWGYGGYGGYGGWGGYYAPGAYANFVAGDWALIATDVTPETTRVFLDGVFIGMVEDFAGPEFLYLKKGDYQIEFRLDGFETKAINLTAQPGAQMKISEKLKKVPGAPQYGSYDNPEPQGGVQRYWTKEKSAPAHSVSVQAGPSQAEPWRGNNEPAEGSQADAGQEPEAPESGGQVAMDPAPQTQAQAPAAANPEAKSRARIIFRVTPGDAAIYLNDHFIGTGEELSTLTRGFQVPPGQHSLTVSRPGMVTREETVVVGPGKSETVEIVLQRN